MVTLVGSQSTHSLSVVLPACRENHEHKTKWFFTFSYTKSPYQLFSWFSLFPFKNSHWRTLAPLLIISPFTVRYGTGWMFWRPYQITQQLLVLWASLPNILACTLRFSALCIKSSNSTPCSKMLSMFFVHDVGDCVQIILNFEHIIHSCRVLALLKVHLCLGKVHRFGFGHVLPRIAMHGHKIV